MEKELVPGIGIGGVVMCPYGFQRSPCLKGGCELWVELTYAKHIVGRCSVAWNSILLTEIRKEIESLRKGKESL